MYYVYVLKSIKDDKLYIGYTNNLKKRIFEHNNKLLKSTAPRIFLSLFIMNHIYLKLMPVVEKKC